MLERKGRFGEPTKTMHYFPAGVVFGSDFPFTALLHIFPFCLGYLYMWALAV